MAQRFWESLGYSVINEFLSLFLNKDGFSKSARYEVVIGLPKAATSTAGELLNTETARKVSYHAETIAFPGRNLEIKEDLSTYGPTREIVSGSSFSMSRIAFATRKLWSLSLSRYGRITTFGSYE